MKRFFKARAQGGSLYPWGSRAAGPLDPTSIDFQTEEEVTWLIRVGAGPHSRVNTMKDLDYAIFASQSVSISITLYVHEGLLDEVRRRIEG